MDIEKLEKFASCFEKAAQPMELGTSQKMPGIPRTDLREQLAKYLASKTWGKVFFNAGHDTSGLIAALRGSIKDTVARGTEITNVLGKIGYPPGMTKEQVDQAISGK